MTKTTRRSIPVARHYAAPDISLRAIRRYARAIAQRFQPDKIILFGSFAYGTPDADSDVDLLVIMPARNQGSQAYKIRLALAAPFALDLLVRTPETMAWRLAEGDSFLQEIVTRGKVLYEKADGRMGAQSRRRLSGRGPNPSQRRRLS
jgi:predicted nucleotidyltransferase